MAWRLRARVVRGGSLGLDVDPESEESDDPALAIVRMSLSVWERTFDRGVARRGRLE